MTIVENIENQINSLTNDDWNRLFSLIPEIEQSKSFGEMKGGRTV